jgi:hypothetical protein
VHGRQQQHRHQQQPQHSEYTGMVVRGENLVVNGRQQHHRHQQQQQHSETHKNGSYRGTWHLAVHLRQHHHRTSNSILNIQGCWGGGAGGTQVIAPPPPPQQHSEHTGMVVRGEDLYSGTCQQSITANTSNSILNAQDW